MLEQIAAEAVSYSEAGPLLPHTPAVGFSFARNDFIPSSSTPSPCYFPRFIQLIRSTCLYPTYTVFHHFIRVSITLRHHAQQQIGPGKRTSGTSEVKAAAESRTND